MTAAHRRLPLGSQVKVANLENGREAIFKINDRGPYVINRIVDLTQKGAQDLGFARDGIVPVKLEVVACGQWVKADAPVEASTPQPEVQQEDAKGAEPRSPIPWERIPVVPPQPPSASETPPPS
jgi:rare lipoprotein A